MDISFQKNSRGGGVFLAFLIALSVTPRLFLAVFYPASGGDWKQSYLPVALNILRNQCVSLSDPATAACLPTWGGNQLPGYSAFVAAIWTFAPDSTVAILVGQTIVFALAVFYFSSSLSLVSKHRVVPAIAALLLMLSPQILPWSRFLQTETLSIAVTLWVFAELLRSLSRKKLRLFPIGLAIATAIFLRYDSVLLVIPVALTGFSLYRFPTALGKGLIIAVIVAIPLGTWALRSVSLGLSLVPDVTWTKYGGEGYLTWGFTWKTSQYQNPDWEYPIATGMYSQIRIDPEIYVNDHEQNTVTRLLDELAGHDRNVMPERIDNAFADLALVRRNNHPVRTFLTIPATRAWNLWFNPYNSYGWPVSIGKPDRSTVGVEASRLQRAINIAMTNPLALFVKVGNAVWRLGVLVLTIVLFLLLRKHISTNPTRVFIYAILAFAVTRTLFLSGIGLVEARYLLPAVALTEVASIILLIELYYLKFRGNIADDNHLEHEAKQ
jgi:hypothetical protein